MTRQSTYTKTFRRWHKRLGLVAAVFFVFLALSGVALNHGDGVGLEQKRVDAPWLMAWYGLKAQAPETGYRLEGTVFAWQEDTWALGSRRLKAGRGYPVGAVRLADQIWIATADELSLYLSDGELVDRMAGSVLPNAGIRRIGSVDGRLAVEFGNAAYATADGIEWQPVAAGQKFAWSRLQPLTGDQRDAMTLAFAPSLSLQRVLADVHSGRIYGRYGIAATDVLALILLFIALSGIWIYLKSRQSAYPHRSREQDAPPADRR